MSDVCVKRDDNRIDALEAAMMLMPDVDIPIKHLFVKGMYVRQMEAPAGSLITSKIHKTQHPFTLSKGKLSVKVGDDWQEVTAPYTGVTQPGTRRVAIVLEDCVWTTYHAFRTIKGTENELPEYEQQLIIDRIEHRIIQKHRNRLLEQTKKELL